jgi:predicted DsbA family dithiol-disulfide isomerase
MYSNFVGEVKGVPTDKYLKDLAARLNLDTAQFNTCLDSGKNRQQIAEEKRAATERGITGTPGFVIKVGDKEEVVKITTSTYAEGLTAKLDEALKSVGESR